MTDLQSRSTKTCGCLVYSDVLSSHPVGLRSGRMGAWWGVGGVAEGLTVKGHQAATKSGKLLLNLF